MTDGGGEGADSGGSSDDPATVDEVPDDVRERVESDPFCATLGIDLVALGPGTATTELSVTPDHLNFHGTLHGGALYSLADAAFAAASNSRGETALALETNVSYLEAVDAGATLRATAEETYRGDRTAEYEVVVGRVDDVAGAEASEVAGAEASEVAGAEASEVAGAEASDVGDRVEDADRVATFRGRVYLP